MVEFTDIIRDIHIADVIDWLIVSTLIYQIVLLVQGTRSFRIIMGLAILFCPLFISPWIKLNTIYFLLMKVLPMGFIALVVLFQPELRRALETIGRGSSISKKFFGFDDEALHKIVNELKKASLAISRRKAGALIVLERSTGLQEFIETGMKLNSDVLSELIVSVFIPTTPLHDGAIIIREDKILAAACFLPLSESTTIAKELGTRHRAAFGISEVSDALVIVISEETGAISIVFNGKMTRNIDYDTLGRLLLKMYKLNYNISSFIKSKN